ncbi:MAG: methionyl-tRNA formyltransferase [Lysobacterales bacterium]
MNREPLRLVFAGTPAFAVPCLEAALASGETLLAVYSQPDRPAGRGRQLAASPVKQRAIQAGIPVRQPSSLRTLAARRDLAALQPDLLIVVAYGLILGEKVLAIPRFGCWNIHASLLPRWRGAAPIQRAIEAGDAETGVDLMQMDAGLDTGPTLLRRRSPISATDTGGSVHDRLSRLGAELLAEGLERLRAGRLPAPTPQSDLDVSYAHKIDKAEAVLDFAQPASVLERRVRAFLPWPVAECQVEGERLRVHAAVALAGAAGGAPGSLVGASRDGLDIACAEGRLRLTLVQRDGGRPIGATDYLNARPELRIGP